MTLSNVFYVINEYKVVIKFFTAKNAGQLYGMFVVYCVVTVCNVGYVYSFCGEHIFVDFISFYP